MSKQRKKVQCTCRGKADRHIYGKDHQRHAPGCPIVKLPQGGSV